MFTSNLKKSLCRSVRDEINLKVTLKNPNHDGDIRFIILKLHSYHLADVGDHHLDVILSKALFFSRIKVVDLIISEQHSIDKKHFSHTSLDIKSRDAVIVANWEESVTSTSLSSNSKIQKK